MVNSGVDSFMIGAAAGTNWKKRNKITFRHAAGVEGSKFLK